MSKWITFHESDAYPEFKTCVWNVCTTELPQMRIGVVRWYGPWRQYCFVPDENTVYNAECLEDIAKFCRDNRSTRNESANV